MSDLIEREADTLMRPPSTVEELAIHLEYSAWLAEECAPVARGRSDPWSTGYWQGRAGAYRTSAQIMRALPASTRYAELERAARAICDPPTEDDGAPIDHVLVPPSQIEALFAALDALDGEKE